MSQIESKKDYLFFLEADKRALNIKTKRPRWFRDEIWCFQRSLRRVEYYTNCKQSLLWRPLVSLLRLRLRRMGVRFGFTIPSNVFGPGLSIAHIGTIVVSPAAKVGANCRIHTCVNIGTKAGASEASPILGDNVYIGPGAKIFGAIQIADGIAIGANAVVNRSFLEPNIAIAGVPAKKINDHGSMGLLIRGTESVE